MIRMLIVEDEPGIRETLFDFFSQRDFVVDAVETVKAACDALKRGSYSIVLLDLLLPDGDGLHVLEHIRLSRHELPVIIITARGEEAQRVRGLERGADDYVVKPFSVHELLARVRAVIRRVGSRPTRVELGNIEVDLDGFRIIRDGVATRLLQKEAELLAFFLRHPGRTFRREDLLHEVWGFDAAPTTRTVDTHVFQLRRKLGESPDRPRLIQTIRGVGYRLVLPE